MSNINRRKASHILPSPLCFGPGQGKQRVLDDNSMASLWAATTCTICTVQWCQTRGDCEGRWFLEAIGNTETILKRTISHRSKLTMSLKANMCYEVRGYIIIHFRVYTEYHWSLQRLCMWCNVVMVVMVCVCMCVYFSMHVFPILNPHVVRVPYHAVNLTFP